MGIYFWIRCFSSADNGIDLTCWRRSSEHFLWWASISWATCLVDWPIIRQVQIPKYSWGSGLLEVFVYCTDTWIPFRVGWCMIFNYITSPIDDNVCPRMPGHTAESAKPILPMVCDTLTSIPWKSWPTSSGSLLDLDAPQPHTRYCMYTCYCVLVQFCDTNNYAIQSCIYLESILCSKQLFPCLTFAHY